MKVVYTRPETDVISVKMKRGVLTVSQPSGVSTQGFTSAGSYSDDDWDIQ